MRTNKKGEHYFLEINPDAQYLFVEVVTNQPITRTLARLLADPVRSKEGFSLGAGCIQKHPASNKSRSVDKKHLYRSEFL